MPKQLGIVKFKGTMGGMTFYKTQDGHLVKEKSSISAEKIANDPAFARTRENGSEFGRAGTAGKILRTALRPLLANVADARVASRLTSDMVKVIQADATSTRGLRNVLDGELELLTGFDFNTSGKLKTVLYLSYTPSIDRVTGIAEVQIPAFVPAIGVSAPQGATHMKIISGAAAIDFETGDFELDSNESAVLAVGNQNQAAITLTNNLTPNSTKPLFLVLGIEFYQDTNGIKYPLNNGGYNALGLVKIDGV